METMTREAVKHLCDHVFRAASVLQVVRWQSTAEASDLTRGSKENGTETYFLPFDAHLVKT